MRASADRAVAHIRRDLVVAELRRGAAVDLRPEVRQILQRAQVIALGMAAEETIAELERSNDRPAHVVEWPPRSAGRVIFVAIRAHIRSDAIAWR
jgi:hypothetical protein